MKVNHGDALLVVDLQVDFCPGGALPVPGGDEIVPTVNSLVRLFLDRGGKVVFSRDWHPENHCSFKEHNGIWPPHCVQNSSGAAFHPDLIVPPEAIVVSKGTNPKEEAYSAFGGTDLHVTLNEAGARRIFLCGLATDYCVKASAMDALKLGFEAYVIVDAVRGVDVSHGDSAKALEEIEAQGGKLINSKELE
jgi:nicotinamidase/pyrazinamidase